MDNTLNTLNDYSEGFASFLEGMRLFNSSRIAVNKLSELIELGLVVFLKIPGAKRASFFRINEDTFDFELKMSVPDDSDSLVMGNHDKLVEEGIIGEAISSSNIAQFTLDDEEFIYVAPLITQTGIIGIVEVYSTIYRKEEFNDIEISIVKLATAFSGFFASALNEFMLKEKDHDIKELVDQIVASRTISLAKKQQEIGSKLESLKWNLSMSIPHEVRTPLNQIIGFANYLNSFVKAEYSESADLLEIIGDIQSSAVRLKRLFENYLYFANLTMVATNIDELRKVSEKVTLYAESIIFEYANIIADKYDRTADININLVESALKISEDYLIKIIEEIIDNALKYSEPGTEVNINSIFDDSYYYLTITDQGRGMTEHQIKGIDAYMQFDRDQYEQQGSGLGLAIVSRIMDLQNGELHILSVPNECTEVTLKIPIAKNDISDYL